MSVLYVHCIYRQLCADPIKANKMADLDVHLCMDMLLCMCMDIITTVRMNTKNLRVVAGVINESSEQIYVSSLGCYARQFFVENKRQTIAEGQNCPKATYNN